MHTQTRSTIRTAGEHLRDWRQRRRLSQLDLAHAADISPRHLSFLETGRSQPSREMVLRLAERLEVPPRERNALLVAAGFAPMFRARALDDPALEAAKRAIERILDAQKPYPAFAVDRHWNIVATDHALPGMYEGVAPELLGPGANAMRLALHPKGVAPRIENLAEWRAHLLARLAQQVANSADPVLAALLEELSGYPAPEGEAHLHDPAGAIAVPLRIRTPMGTLSFISTITIFGTPVDVTLSELALEQFFPADAGTARAVAAMA